MRPRSSSRGRHTSASVYQLQLQWIDHLKQSAAFSTSIRAVTERVHTWSDDAPVLDCPAHRWNVSTRFRRRI